MSLKLFVIVEEVERRIRLGTRWGVLGVS